MITKRPKRLLSTVLVLALAFGILSVSAFASGSLGNFTDRYTYRWGQFSDVDENKWYGANRQAVIKSSYELGLMQGNNPSSFAPVDFVQISHIITMASRIHNIYNGGTGVFTNGSPWYQNYVNYAIESGIIPYNFEQAFQCSYTAYAPRWLVAYIFANTVPDSELTPMTSIYSLPDVTENTSGYEEIIKLYEAGVLQGSDANGTFYPYNPITRAESAAIACWLVSPSLRQAIEQQTELVPGYSDEEIANYFVEIAFGEEYSGDNTILCKWSSPIYVDVYGTVTDADWAQMDALFAKLNSISGFPGIYYASDYGAYANLDVYYIPPSDFDNVIPMPSDNLWGFAQYYYSSGFIVSGTVLLPSEEANQWYRNSIICEELIQVLGLTQDSWLYPDSIFYQDSNDTQWPTELDWTVVRLLYNPAMRPLMSKEQARATVLELIGSWK